MCVLCVPLLRVLPLCVWIVRSVTLSDISFNDFQGTLVLPSSLKHLCVLRSDWSRLANENEFTNLTLPLPTALESVQLARNSLTGKIPDLPNVKHLYVCVCAHPHICVGDWMIFGCVCVCVREGYRCVCLRVDGCVHVCVCVCVCVTDSSCSHNNFTALPDSIGTSLVELYTHKHTHTHHTHHTHTPHTHHKTLVNFLASDWSVGVGTTP